MTSWGPWELSPGLVESCSDVRWGSCEACWGQSQIQKKGFRLCVQGTPREMAAEPPGILFPCGAKAMGQFRSGQGAGFVYPCTCVTVSSWVCADVWGPRVPTPTPLFQWLRPGSGLASQENPACSLSPSQLWGARPQHLGWPWTGAAPGREVGQVGTYLGRSMHM